MDSFTKRLPLLRRRADEHTQPEVRDTDASLNTTSAEINAARNSVTLRAFVVGLLLSLGIAALNCWIETLANVHFVGGVQMPFGAIFSLFFFILAVNLPLRLLARSDAPVGTLARRFFPPFAPAELLAVYAMMLFGALVSTPGADNLFLTVAPALFYFGTRENRWAETFYEHVPSWFAPGWDGQTYRREVIEPLYIGGLSIAEIPWHAWTAMILAWSVLLLLAYATLFWTALLFRRQWIENEVLAFPLVQLPLQMVEVDEHDAHPPARAFWTNRAMWAGFVLALSFHFLRGMNNFFPDWPTPAAFQGGPTKQVTFAFTEKPWLALGAVLLQIYLGGIGIAYLLTRELSLSFWVFFLLARFQLVLAEQLGFPADSLTKGPYVPFGGRALPIFIEFQTIGGWLMTAMLLVWTARLHLLQMWREAVTPHSQLRTPHSQLRTPHSNEPFSPRCVVIGLVISLGGLLAWSWFAGINLLFAATFFSIYLMTSLVLARLVIEGGLLFPQAAFMPLEWMTTGLFGTAAIGAASLTKLSFLQAAVTTDMRSNTLPAFLHTLKLAHEQGLKAGDTRRLLGAVAVATVAALSVTIFVSLATLYAAGGLASYSFSATLGPQRVFTGAAGVLREQPGVQASSLGWMGVGMSVVWLLTFLRSRFVWFPLHPLGFIAAPSYGLLQLWFSFFVGWAIKTLLIKFGGNDAYVRVRPFMIGLIFGNATAMVLWMLIGFRLGGQIPYWPA